MQANGSHMLESHGLALAEGPPDGSGGPGHQRGVHDWVRGSGPWEVHGLVLRYSD